MSYQFDGIPRSFPPDSAGALLHAKHVCSFALNWNALNDTDARTPPFARLGRLGHLAAVPGPSNYFFQNDLWLCPAHPSVVRRELGLPAPSVKFKVSVEIVNASRTSNEAPPPCEGPDDLDPVLTRGTAYSEEKCMPRINLATMVGTPGDEFDKEYISSYADLPSWPPTPERTVTELPEEVEVKNGEHMLAEAGGASEEGTHIDQDCARHSIAGGETLEALSQPAPVKKPRGGKRKRSATGKPKRRER
ncbi:unnamed protein product [Peniophora sp. CBMAI 1063]|nr:unnamed protein product [Peniophora sp. CBMAI 1063]